MSTIKDQNAKYADFPRTPYNKVDKKAVKRLYDESPHVEWSLFVESQGWSPSTSLMYFPTRLWVAEKRGRLQSKMTDEINDFSLSFKNAWLKDMRTTLTEYPKAVDNVMAMVGEWMLMMREKKILATPEQMMRLAGTIKLCIEGKKSILMIGDKVAEVRVPQADDETESNEWKLEIIGGEQMTPKQLTKLITQYRDNAKSPEEEPDAEA